MDSDIDEESSNPPSEKVKTIFIVPKKVKKKLSSLSSSESLTSTVPSSFVVQSSLPTRNLATSLPAELITETSLSEYKSPKSLSNDDEDDEQQTFDAGMCESELISCLSSEIQQALKESFHEKEDEAGVTKQEPDYEENVALNIDSDFPPSHFTKVPFEVKEEKRSSYGKGKMEILSERRVPHSEETLSGALQDVIDGNMSIKRAAHLHGIKYSVLVSKLKGHGSNTKSIMGADPALTEKEEESLVEWIRDRYKKGFPVKKIDLIHKVAEIVSDGRPTRFKEGVPGEKWFCNFMYRHPNVTTLGPSARADSRGVPSKRSLVNWFTSCLANLHAFGQENLINDERRVGNADELILCLNHSVTKVSSSGKLDSFYLPEEASGNISSLIGACADGELMPPMTVFACQKPTSELVRSVPSGWGIGLSKSGSITKEVLLSYFKNILIPWLADQQRLPFILFIDKLRSYLSVDIADFCAQKGLLIYNLFPNTEHVLQPLYKTIIKSIKKSWNTVSHFKNDKQALLNFCRTLNAMLNETASPETIMGSFKDCGLFPFDSKAPDYTRCALSDVDKDVKNFTSTDYALALDVFEDTIGKLKTEIFRESLQGLKLLKAEDAPLYKIWFTLISKVDVTRSQSSELQEFRHDKVVKGASRRLPRPETFLRVVDENEDDAEGLVDLAKVNLFSFPTEISTISADSSEPSAFIASKDEGGEVSEFIQDGVDGSIDPGEILISNEVPQCMTSDFWNNLFLGERGCEREKERIKEVRREERIVKKQRKMVEISEFNKNIKKKIKRALDPRLCYVCWGEKGKLIVCKACRKFIHFECMMEDEKQLLSDLFLNNVEFDYICLPCSS